MISKGELVGRIIDRTEIISSQMNDLFSKNGIGVLELKRLPQTDRDKWLKLYKRQHRLGDLMCYIALGK